MNFVIGLKKIKRFTKKALGMQNVSGVSGNYRIIKNPNLKALKEKYNNVWKDDSIPAKQHKVNENNLSPDIPHFKAIIELIKKTGLCNPKILEIGCSTGYLSEILKKANTEAEYQGSDYSPAFIDMAKKIYPDTTFKVSDATALDYEKNQFDIAISGCCILHIIDYKKAISEAVRVSNNFVIFHRTPVIHINPTVYTKKTGYDLEMLEILFNEEELFDIFKANNLTVQSVNTHKKISVEGLDEPFFMKSYLCRKNVNF